MNIWNKIVMIEDTGDPSFGKPVKVYVNDELMFIGDGILLKSWHLDAMNIEDLGEPIEEMSINEDEIYLYQTENENWFNINHYRDLFCDHFFMRLIPFESWMNSILGDFVEVKFSKDVRK